MYKEENGEMFSESVKVEKPKARSIFVYEGFILNKNYSMAEKLLYQILDMYHNKGMGGAFPSQDEMCKQLGVSKPTLLKTLKSMQEKNMILVINCFWKNNNKQAHNFYVLNEPDEMTGEFDKNALALWRARCPNKKALVFKGEHKGLWKYEWK